VACLRLATLVALSIVVRFGAALLVRTPLYFPDEYLYQSLARGLAHGHFPEVRGGHVATSETLSYLQPVVTAPLWRLHDVALSYRLVQLLGSIVFSCTALPVYGLARRLGAGEGASLFAAALSLAVPAGLFTGAVMPEPYAYPAYLGVLLLAVDTVTRPTAGRIAAAAVSAVGLIFVGGLQFTVVLPALVAAGAAVLRTRRHRAVLLGGLALFASAVVLGARFASPGLAGKAALLHQPLGPTLGWLGINAFLLAVGAGWATTPGGLVGIASLARSPRPSERFFGVAAILLVAGFLFEAALWSSTFDRTYQRFAFYAVPLLLIGFVTSAERVEGRRLAYAALGCLCAAGAAIVPFTAGMHVDNPYAPPLTGLALHRPSATAAIWAPLLAVTGLGACVASRRVITAAGGAIAVACGAVAAFAVIHFARQFPVTRLAVPAGAVYVSTPREDAFAEMRTLFWNPQIERVATLDGGTAPDGFAALQAVLRPDGTITDATGAAIRGPFVSAGPLDKGVVVRVAHCLRAVACARLREDPVDVRLHGRVGQVEPCGDLLVRQAGRDQLQHLSLALRQSVRQLRGLGRLDGRRERGCDEPLLDGGVEMRPPLVHRPDRALDLLGAGVLGQISLRARLERREERLVVRIRREDEDPRVGDLVTDLARRRDAVQHGHTQVHQNDVRPLTERELDGLGAVGDGPDHLDAFEQPDEQRQAVTQRPLIIGDQNANAHPGTSTSTRKPRSVAPA